MLKLFFISGEHRINNAAAVEEVVVCSSTSSFRRKSGVLSTRMKSRLLDPARSKIIKRFFVLKKHITSHSLHEPEASISIQEFGTREEYGPLFISTKVKHIPFHPMCPKGSLSTLWFHY
nr:mechanosensitive ion channel protein 6-like [Ipomoea batatas]